MYTKMKIVSIYAIFEMKSEFDYDLYEVDDDFYQM